MANITKIKAKDPKKPQEESTKKESPKKEVEKVEPKKEVKAVKKTLLHAPLIEQRGCARGSEAALR